MGSGPYRGPYSGRATLFAVVVTFLLLAALGAVVTLCGCVPIEDVDAAMLPPEETVVTEHANGMPLDAIEYDPPAWMPWCGRAYRVCDRTTGDEWWLLVMENQGMHGQQDVSYVVLPIGGQYDPA
jgi:hypothetical protein